MPELTPELIADLSIPRDLDLSPDGSLVAYALVPNSKREEHPTAAIWVVPADGSSLPRQFTAGSAHDRSPRWSPDGGSLAFLSDRVERGTAQLYVIPRDGGEARALTDGALKRGVTAFRWTAGGGHIAFTSTDEPDEEEKRREEERDDVDVWGRRPRYARLRLVSLAGGEVETLYAGNRHVSEFAPSPDGREIAFITTRDPTLEAMEEGVMIARVPAGGGETHTVCTLPYEASGLAWSADGANLYFSATVSRLWQSSYAVYTVPVTGGEPRHLALGEDRCGGVITYVPGTDRPAVMEWQVLQTRIAWLDPKSGETSPITLDEPAEINEFAIRRIDGQTVLATMRSSADNPPAVWVGRAEGMGPITEFQQLTHHLDDLLSCPFGVQEPFYWTSPDGWEMDGILIRPRGAAEGVPLPTVVLVHGGPYGRWGQNLHLSWGDWGQWLATDGYAVVMPNPRGGLGHGDTFAAAARRDVGGADWRDVLAAADAAVERGIADPDRMGIGGWSQGGFMTAWAVTQTSRFRAGVMGAGVSDWGMMAMTSDVPWFEIELAGAPWEFRASSHYLEQSPITYAGDTTTPVLILHGQNDARVPLSQAIGFHRALRAAGVPVEMAVYPREPHGITERAHQIDVLRRVRSWYDRWLRG